MRYLITSLIVSQTYILHRKEGQNSSLVPELIEECENERYIIGENDCIPGNTIVCHYLDHGIY